MKAGTLNLSADFSNAAAALGTIDGIAKRIDTPYHEETVVELSHAWMQKDFDTFMNAMARSQPDRFHHVYEFGMIGLDPGKLWEHHLTGFGANRVASFTFKPTKVPVPKPTLPASDTGKQLSGKKHFFFWKAAVMEFGQTVHISARPGGMLLIPLGNRGVERHSGETTSKEFIFTETAVNFHPGGEVAGNFSAAWLGWWGSQADTSFEKVRHRLEQDYRKVQRIGMKRNLGRYGVVARFGKTSAKSIQIMADTASAKAQAEIIANERKYKREARILAAK